MPQRKFRNREERISVVQEVLAKLSALKDAIHTDPSKTKAFETNLEEYVKNETGRCFQGSFDLDVAGHSHIQVVSYALQGRRVLKCDLRIDAGAEKPKPLDGRTSAVLATPHPVTAESLKLALILLIVAFTGYLLHSNEENFFMTNKNNKPSVSAAAETEETFEGDSDKVRYEDRLQQTFERLYGRPPSEAERVRAFDVLRGNAEAVTDESVHTIVKISEMAVSDTRIRDALISKFKEASRAMESSPPLALLDELTVKVLDGSLSIGDAERRATYLGLQRTVKYDEVSPEEEEEEEDDREDMVLIPGLKWSMERSTGADAADDTRPPPRPLESQTTLIGMPLNNQKKLK